MHPFGNHSLINVAHVNDTNTNTNAGGTSQEMPCGMFIRRKSEENFTREYPLPYSAASTEWLANIEYTQHIQIDHARNVGEYRIGPKRMPVDGFCR